MRSLYIIILIFTSSNLLAQADWTRKNTCEYTDFDNTDLIEKLIKVMSIEEKVGQVIQGDLDFISPADVRAVSLC